MPLHTYDREPRTVGPVNFAIIITAITIGIMFAVLEVKAQWDKYHPPAAPTAVTTY